MMSDIESERITVRIPGELGGRLRYRSRVKGQTESELVREALENYLGQPNGERSAFEMAEEAGVIGSVRLGDRTPARSPAKDLSTNPRHFRSQTTVSYRSTIADRLVWLYDVGHLAIQTIQCGLREGEVSGQCERRAVFLNCGRLVALLLERRS